MSTAQQRYVVGFLIDSVPDQRVLLVRKTKPDWQKGYLNGVGGHVKKNETGDEAIVREFYEETGLTGLSWDHFATLGGPEAVVYAYRCFASPVIMDSAVTQTAVDPLEVHLISSLDYDEAVNSLSWLVPVALHAELDAPVHARGAR